MALGVSNLILILTLYPPIKSLNSPFPIHSFPFQTPIKNPIFFLSHSFLISLNSTLFKIPIKIQSFPSTTHSSIISHSPTMATTSLNSLHLPNLHHQPTSSSSFSSLATHLSAANFRQADETTRSLLISLAGEPAQKRGYVFFSEVQYIAAADLRAIDDLWLSHSAGRLGYSVQRKVWDKSMRDFTKFFINVGWMRRMDTEVEQFNYRSFPEDFVWGLDDGMPEGHLPLTNALRGTQLLGSILLHPAFEVAVEDGGKEIEGNERGGGFNSRKLMNPDYSF